MLGPEDAADFRARGARVRAWLDELVRLSQPFTVSFSVHVAALIALALVFVRIDRERRRPIDLDFATATPAQAEKPGVQLVQQRSDHDRDSETDAPAETPRTDDFGAAQQPTDEQVADASGTGPLRAAAPAVGTLLDGREPGSRERLLADYGGSAATEAAVARALDWIVRQQGKDGLWSLQGPYLDRAPQENRLAATAMALLALQGAGTTPEAGKHKAAVARAWNKLLTKQSVSPPPDDADATTAALGGRFRIGPQDPPPQQAHYAQAQATIALCELYGMTRESRFEEPAQRAVAYAVAAQGPDGGWRYDPGQRGDMSVTGWFMMALKSAQMAGLDVPEDAFAGLARFLDAMAVEQGSRYGYLLDGYALAGAPGPGAGAPAAAGPVTEAVSAEGLLCRQYLGWPRGHPQLVRGVDALLAGAPLDWDRRKDVYAWYYITQVAHHLGGPAWQRWNGRLREVLPERQVPGGREAGSWDPGGDKWGPFGGRLFTTCLCTCMLEVYYRHLPLYGAAAVATADVPTP